MQMSPRRIEDLPIDGLRRDAVLAMRGYFMLGLIPTGLLVPAITQVLRSPAGFDWRGLLQPHIFLLTAAAALALFAGRRYALQFSRRSLAGMRIALGSIVLGAVAIASFLVWWFLIASGTIARLDDALLLALVLGLALLGLSPVLYFQIWQPVRAARRLVQQPIGHDGLPFSDVSEGLERLALAGGSGTSVRRSRVNPKSIVLAGVAVLLGCIGAGAGLWLLSRDEPSLALAGFGVEALTIAAILLLTREARRSAARSAEDILREDYRPPILYLRSFQDDAGSLGGEWGIVADFQGRIAESLPGPFRRLRLWFRRAFTGVLNTSGRLEEMMAAELNRFGPFVGIGAPDERLPELGAARAYFDNDTWQSAIERWVDISSLIIKAAGPTKWIRWELDTVMQRGALGKLIVLMPPIESADRPARWQNIVDAFAGTDWHPALGEISPDRLVALRFLEGGRLSTVTGGQGRFIDYQLALRLMLHGMLSQRPQLT